MITWRAVFFKRLYHLCIFNRSPCMLACFCNYMFVHVHVHVFVYFVHYIYQQRCSFIDVIMIGCVLLLVRRLLAMTWLSSNTAVTGRCSSVTLLACGFRLFVAWSSCRPVRGLEQLSLVRDLEQLLEFTRMRLSADIFLE